MSDLDQPISKRDALQLIRELIEVSYHMEHDTDDPSGLHTRYLVDQGKLLKAIDVELNRDRRDPFQE